MADADHQYGYYDETAPEDDQPIVSTRGLEAFGRKVTTTASHLMGPLSEAGPGNPQYQSAMAEVHKQLKRPTMQRSMFSMARTTPSEMVRAKLSKTEIQHRALTYLPDELLVNIPDNDNSYSLFQGFQASFPELTDEGKKHKRRVSRGRKLIDDGKATPGTLQSLHNLKQEKSSMMHELEMLSVRKNMASSEIREIDIKIANLGGMRRIILERLELDLAGDHEDDGFMSQSVYEKIPASPSTPSKSKRPRTVRRKSMPILHEHFEPGTAIREIRAHQDTITALDFDAPFGTMVTSAMDDTVKVWDLNAGRCIGMLEGHTASVRALQVEDNILATGSRDATIRLWDLSKAHYDPQGGQFGKGGEEDDDGIAFENPDDQPVDPPEGSMDDCHLFTLQAHVDEITALHFRGDILVSGSADKTLRHWDLEKGRCIQTLDIMWAATQASATMGDDGPWRQTSRSLWDLRSGTVHRSLVGHTGPVTCLQFDDVHLVTGSADRSIRIWDLRTGSISDAYAYDHGITSMMFDARRIVSAAGEDVVKVYDKLEGRQWECGAGIVQAEEGKSPAVVEQVRVRDGYMVEGRQDGIVGVWTC
ncbi:Mitochondrial division protein 1 like [Verticillium longisporum]|uniref:Mitochondrial division protein 1 like n=1 Tax=Verticillium longisporum TaxID=100787 RepID=A0A8I2Z980_VERLO|nr:Mitochondrial division protein 1 like [Verticillium longisporum]